MRGQDTGPISLSLADLVALAHALFSVVVVSGLVLLAAGLVLGWRWVRRPGFRIAHCGAVLFVAARAWLGLPCPLTWLEDHLRAGAAENRSALIRQAHAAAFRGEDPNHFRWAVSAWALASVGLCAFPLLRRRTAAIPPSAPSSSRGLWP